MATLAIFFYRLLGATLVWPLAFFLKGHPNFKGTIAQRLGYVLPEAPALRKSLWIHTASVGEVKAVSGLVNAIRQQWPEVFIFMSSMTVTGRAMACKMPEVDLVFPFPFDLSWVMKRYLLRLMPCAILVVETEIWPNMLLAAQDLAIPVVFVNARMSEKSYVNYQKVSLLLNDILKEVRVLAIAGPDAQRFSDLGSLQVEVLGNLKLDAVPESGNAEEASLRESLGSGSRPIFIAGSVREGEETMVVDAIIRAASSIKGLYSIIAPRHPDRIEYIAKMAEGLDIKWGLRSNRAKDVDLLIIDTMGELFNLYGISDAAFVGGSLVDLGGQNILEPVAWGVPTIHGPHMDNFTWALDAVKGNTFVVKDARELAETIIKVLNDLDGSREKGKMALDALRGEQGVTKRYIQVLESLL
jgi:3-deoxy-D-manno-octulosonic-acid transferase